MSGVCRNFAERGNCRFGDDCRFSHDIEGQGPPQRYNNANFDSRRGRDDRNYDSNSRDRPQSSVKPACKFFAEHGNCRFGDNCRFSHDTRGGQTNIHSQNSRNTNTQQYNQSSEQNYRNSDNQQYNDSQDRRQHITSGRPYSFTNTPSSQTKRFENFSFINPKKPQSVFQRGTFALKIPTLEVEETDVEVELNPEDIEQYEKSSFDVGKIPLTAPSNKFCH